MRKERSQKRISILFIILLLIFIWGNSALSSSSSNKLSDTVTSTVGREIIHNKTQEKNATTWLTSVSIRKLAHVTEFAVLGIITLNLACKRRRTVIEHIPSVLLFGLLMALIDETIQLFSGRSSSVKDVWIDFGGFLLGCVLVYVISLVSLKRRNKNNTSNTQNHNKNQ